MTDPITTKEEALRRHAEIDARILQIPRVRAAIDKGTETPYVMIRCPKNHPMVEVTLGMTSGEQLFLVATDATADAAKGTVMDGWDGLFGSREATDAGAITRDRVRFKCPTCSRSPVRTKGDLLGRYALALQTGKPSIRLPE